MVGEKGDKLKMLQKQLNKVFSSVIESYSYDLLEHKITMVCRVAAQGLVKKHVLEFLRVATVYHVNGSDDKSRKKISPPDADSYVQVDGIGIIEAPLDIEVRCDAPGWEDGCKGGGNIVMEIWDGTLVIETAEVRVDGESFVIGDW